MARFCSLYSGSSGNSIFLGSAQTGVLIDAGVSARSILTALNDKNIDCECIKAVFITHEHIDHIKGLNVLLKRFKIPVYGSKETLHYIQQNDCVPTDAELHEITDKTVVGDIEVECFDTPHDSLHSLGYRFTMPDERKIAVATDLGHISDAVRASLNGCDLVMLEANYDDQMLFMSRYPYHLKRRIKSDIGHLSNNDCADQIISLVKGGSTRFVLGHLSRENNMPKLAYQTIYNALHASGFVHNTDYTLEVATRQEPSEMTAF